MGRSIALTLAREGASVVVNYRASEESAHAIMAHIQRRGGAAIAVQADVFEADGCRKLVGAALERFHRVDICVIGPGGGWHPEPVDSLIGPYLESARLLGQRTGELHVALASSVDDPSFVPEPITPFYQRSLHQSMRNLASQALQMLRRRLRHLPDEAQEQAQRVLDSEEAILKRIRAVVALKITGTRIRCHGDYHLGQVLYTGKDFVIIDFEGEPARPLSERRIKRSPFRDVAGLLRSFHYAAYFALFARDRGGPVRPEDIATLEPWARIWYIWVSATFLKAYLDSTSGVPFLPEARDELEVMLDASLLEKAIYELGYELNNRPDWVRIPLVGILDLLSLEPTHA